MAKEDFLFLENPMPGQVLRSFADPKAVKEAQEANKKSGSYEHNEPENEVAVLEDADLITSEIQDNAMHKPILDIDFAAQLIPSSTHGHFHLYLDKPITWLKYKKLLRALADAGIIEPGYADASINRGYSAVRLPWIEKPKAPPEEDLSDLIKEVPDVVLEIKPAKQASPWKPNPVPEWEPF